ncbi:chaperonin 10-like protein [Lasiosphaeria ovina]|uniref:Chaperonin 10-like protein n=1 Tax=Lasiosphaeria ovina TaxID=92902 RepID=A0AAE0JX34_9PEZI|nr:chaperonin 10-like protein [Lasiosphaeria ovina]
MALPAGVPETHPAVVTTAPRAPLSIISCPTQAPGAGEVLVRVEWTSSTPLDLHRADGGLAITKYPFFMGSSFAGAVVALGPPPPTALPPLRDAIRELHVGDKVFGFTPPAAAEGTFRTYLTVQVWAVSKLLPQSKLTLQEAVTVPTNLVTVFEVATTDFGLQLPWPIPEGWEPPQAAAPILIWGAASSVGLYAVQVFRRWGYRNILAVASGKHHDSLRALGAKACFDYRQPDVLDKILAHVSRLESSGPKVPFVLDCIASTEETLRPLAKIAERGTKVAILLPVIYVHASEHNPPVYEGDVNKVLVDEWKEGVELRGTRANLYHEKSDFFRDHLQPEIVPTLLEQGVVQPNKQRIIEGKTLLERAQNALNTLRSRAQSAEKLVWRVADNE